MTKNIIEEKVLEKLMNIILGICLLLKRNTFLNAINMAVVLYLEFRQWMILLMDVGHTIIILDSGQIYSHLVKGIIADQRRPHFGKYVALQRAHIAKEYI